MKHGSKGSTLALEPRADVISSQKQGVYQSLQKGLMSSKFFLKNLSREYAIVAKHTEDALLLKCNFFQDLCLQPGYFVIVLLIKINSLFLHYNRHC